MPEMSLLKEVMYLLLAVFLIIAVIGACTNITKNLMTSKEKLQAEGTLDNLANFLSDLKDGESGTFVMYSPKGYHLIAYAKGGISVSECYQKNCICICKDENCAEERVCKEIAKPAGLQSFEIKVNSLFVSASAEKYSFTNTIFDTSDEPVEITAECSGELVDAGGFMLKESAKLNLDKAREIAGREKITLTVVDAYRNYDQQKALWDKSKNSSEVCNPDSGKGTCPHMTGCAVDVCFGDLCDSEKSHVQSDMQTLERIMFEAGFSRYVEEYWHFEYGTSRWQRCPAAAC